MDIGYWVVTNEMIMIVYKILEKTVLSVTVLVFDAFFRSLEFRVPFPDLLLVFGFLVVLDNFSLSSVFDVTLGRNCFTLGGILPGTNLKSLFANGEFSLQKARGTTMRPLATRWSSPMLMKKAMEQQVKMRLKVAMKTPMQKGPATTPRTTGKECLRVECLQENGLYQLYNYL